MKMFYVASLSTNPDRDSSWVDAFRCLNCEVVPFSTDVKYDRTTFLGRICRRFHIGYKNRKMQKNLLSMVDFEKPEWVHFRLPLEFSRKTILALRKRRIVVTEYFNDDPFSKHAPFGLNWCFLNAMTAYNANFVYRQHNVGSFLAAGAAHAEHCIPFYDPRMHKLSERLVNDAFLADVAFIGHWEQDWRLDCLESLANRGFSICLKGGGWDEAIKDTKIKNLSPISHAFGAEYNHIYANVIAGLCFFSKINNDSWTSRAFEIVAVGGVLVCERTDEAITYFKDREEAYFFSTIEELIEIVTELKNNPEKREAVQQAGYKRLTNSAHRVDDKAIQVIQFVKHYQSHNDGP